MYTLLSVSSLKARALFIERYQDGSVNYDVAQVTIGKWWEKIWHTANYASSEHKSCIALAAGTSAIVISDAHLA